MYYSYVVLISPILRSVAESQNFATLCKRIRVYCTEALQGRLALFFNYASKIDRQKLLINQTKLKRNNLLLEGNTSSMQLQHNGMI